MDAMTLYTELQTRKVTLLVNSAGQLTYQAKMGVLTDELIAGMREHKAALLEWARDASTSSTEPGQSQADTPSRLDTESQGRPWYRPTLEQVNTWRAYYGSCAWYANPLGDSPACIALEYVTDGNTAACCALFTLWLKNYYAGCEPRPLHVGPEDTTEQIEPRQFTELLRAAWQERNKEQVFTLAHNFIESAARMDDLQKILDTWTSQNVRVPSVPADDIVPAAAEKHPVSRSNMDIGRDMSDVRAFTSDVSDVRISAIQAESERKPFGVIFADIREGRAITESGARFSFPLNCSLSEFIYHAAGTGPVNRVYVCGARPGESETAESYINWLMDGGMMERYTTSKIGHFFDLKKPDMSVARYQARAERGSLDIRRINAWLGDDRDSQERQLYTIEDARAALLLVTRVLRQHFPLFRNLSGTPSTTFKHLWIQGNHIAKKQFPPLANDIRASIHQNAGQGRIEYFPENCKGKIPGLFYYDGIFMYAALTGELPTEVAAHDTLNEYAGYTPARYRIKYRVPANWRHIGPFMTKRAGADWRDKDGWFYPGQFHQGQEFETWVDGSELHALISYYTFDIVCIRGASPEELQAAREQSRALDQARAFSEWKIEIQERIVFKPWKESQVNRPLETITRKMIDIRAALEVDKHQDTKHAHVYDLARGAVRNILLHGIGSFNRENKIKTYLLMPGEPPPVQLTEKAEYSVLDDGRQVVNIPEDTEPDEMMHPEWAAMVWARCRARMTKHAFSVQASELVTIRTDAIATKSRQERLEGGTKTGQLRRKWAIEKPLAGPASPEKFDDLQHKVTGK